MVLDKLSFRDIGTGLGLVSISLGATCFASILLLIYIIYYHYFHPLSRFPGPLLASFTDLWKSYQVAHGQYEDVLLDLHRKYGKIVRIGPNHLDVSDATAVKAVYGSGRSFKKSSYYDAFTALRPNLFGARDEEVHSARRKAVANGFSLQSVATMEVYMDQCMLKLIGRLDQAAETGEAIDLKTWIAFFVMDVLGELAFSQSFGVLETGDEGKMPPIREHVLLATMSGQTPWVVPYVNKLVPYIPIPRLRRMIEGRAQLRQMAVRCVNSRIAASTSASQGRKDLLGRLLEELQTGSDSKGRALDVVDVQTEAFGFIVAGSHTTAASTTLLLWHLLRSPDALSPLRAEIDALPAPADGSPSFPYSTTGSAAYLQAAVAEGFRISPVFTMPLMRVVPAGGRPIAGAYVPAGTDVSICNHVLHHDEDVFGPDLDRFVPGRWLSAEEEGGGYAETKLGLLMPFGAGHRACVGRNIAVAEIQKLVVSLLRRYDFSLVVDDDDDAPNGGQREAASGRMPPTRSFGVADLEGGLWVRVQRRRR